jgi:hypothetical protein
MTNKNFWLVGSAQAPVEVGTAIWKFAGFCQEQSIIAPYLELIACGTTFRASAFHLDCISDPRRGNGGRAHAATKLVLITARLTKYISASL